MVIAGARDHFARHVPGWTFAGAAMLGVISGLALSALLLDRPALETPAYVQKTSLSESGEGALPLASQLGSLSIPEGDDQAELEGISPAEPPDGAETSGEDAEVRQVEAQELVLADGQTVLGVDFDLGAAGDRSNDIVITKPIHLNGRAVGVASLAIDQQSRLHVSSQDLSNLLPEELFARIDNGGNYIDFDDLRAGGLDISYDPLTDVIEIVS